MANPKPSAIAEWICSDAVNREFSPLAEVASSVLQNRLPGKSPEEIADLIEGVLAQTVTELQSISAKALSEGVVPQFELSEESGATAYFKALDTPERALLDELRRGTPTAFEEFCKNVLAGLGANAYAVGKTRDGGVDFMGFGFPLGGDKGPAPGNSRAVVLGQAKRYAEGNFISELDLRQFIGGAILRAAELRKSKPEAVGALSPVVYAFWTTSSFNLPAKNYAQSMGIWHLNGVGLAQLARRAGIERAAPIQIVNDSSI